MEICTVGGFEEVGKNMTAVKIKDDVFLFDCGFYLPGVIELQEESNIDYTTAALRRVKGIPDDRVLDNIKWRKQVKAIFISHAHLDHVAGFPFVADRYPNAVIYGTPFTIQVLNSLVKDSHSSIPNKRKIVEINSINNIHNVTKNIKVEFIHTTHSTIDSTFVALHTPEGIFFYALDFKFDDTPTFGPPPNYKRLEEIGKQGVKLAIINTLYSYKKQSNRSERDVDKMLDKVLSVAHDKQAAVFVTTFSSHIERLNNIIKHAQKTHREIIVFGRSMAKYINCAMNVGKCPFYNKIKIIKYRGQINSMFKKIDNDRGKYLVICTGHQGEKNSILDRIANGATPFRFKQGDHLIFSSSVIPVEVNQESRRKLDAKLIKMGVELQKDIHVSGHGSRDSKIKLIKLIKPKHIIPSHGNRQQEEDLICITKELGYKLNETSHLALNGQIFKF